MRSEVEAYGAIVVPPDVMVPYQKHSDVLDQPQARHFASVTFIYLLVGSTVFFYPFALLIDRFDRNRVYRLLDKEPPGRLAAIGGFAPHRCAMARTHRRCSVPRRHGRRRELVVPRWLRTRAQVRVFCRADAEHRPDGLGGTGTGSCDYGSPLHSRRVGLATDTTRSPGGDAAEIRFHLFTSSQARRRRVTRPQRAGEDSFGITRP